jgi:hypothetical protein
VTEPGQFESKVRVYFLQRRIEVPGISLELRHQPNELLRGMVAHAFSGCVVSVDGLAQVATTERRLDDRGNREFSSGFPCCTHFLRYTLIGVVEHCNSQPYPF